MTTPKPPEFDENGQQLRTMGKKGIFGGKTKDEVEALRQQVRVLVSLNHNPETIGKVLGWSSRTIRDNFKNELETGKEQITMCAFARTVEVALDPKSGGDGVRERHFIHRTIGGMKPASSLDVNVGDASFGEEMRRMREKRRERIEMDDFVDIDESGDVVDG